MPPLEPQVSVSTLSHSTLRAPFFYALIVAAVVSSIFVAYYSYMVYTTPEEPVSTTEGRVMVPPRELTPEGTILLTLFPKDGTPGGIYQYSFADKTLTPYLISDTHSYITASYKGDMKAILLAVNTKAAELKNKANLFQIAEYQKDTNTFTELTNTNTTYKRHPQWSESLNLFVYSARKNQSATLGATDDFFVYVRDDKGFEQEIATGSMPVLTPDGKSVVVLRNDGLNLIDLTTREEQVIMPAVGNIWMNAQFTVSPKGNYIAWSNPSKGTILITKITSWTPFKAKPLQEIQAYAFWPVFSPNEEYLTYEEFDYSEEGVAVRPRLVLQDIQTPTRRVLQDLDAFDQMKMFVTEWR